MEFWKPGSKKVPSSQKKDDTKLVTPSNKNNSDAKPTLSKGVMGMKFMKQKEEEIAKRKEEVSKRKAEVFVPTRDDEIKCNTQHFDFVAELPGRRSFNGCNKAMERYYESRLEDLNYKKKAEVDNSSETISNEDMIKRYESLISLPRGPNQGKKPSSKPIGGGGGAPNQQKNMNKVYKRDRGADGDDASSKKSRKG